MRIQEKTTTQRFSRPGAVLLKVFAISILLALLTVFVMSLPGFAAETDTEIWEKDGNVVLTPQAAKDLLQEIRTLRAENEALTYSLESERVATLEVIAAVRELREQIQQERHLSQETITLLQKQLNAEKRKTKTVGIIGLVAILALAL
ncbi:MAG: hypothetical protein LUH49_02285 [Cloacibacillus porcorum]|uniref:hypothetical protein n=1 Tax=Cloacibacillus porcorum TaxID=1197717 RepID=UPI0023F0B497|nr:hypothetical protein [Cloacibacillus porcorum]MCD7875791.1 hypothetical protein [Cloacibacillus porcorum]